MKILFFIEGLQAGGKERRLVELVKGLSNHVDLEMELVLTKEEIHYKEIYSTDIKVHFTPRRHLKKDPKIFFKFYKIAKKFKPDIIHVWGNLPAIYAIPAKVLLKIPMINNQITSAPISISKSLLGHKLPFLFSDRIIANSYAGLKSFNAPKNKSGVIYNGFDFNRIKNLKEKDLIRKEFNINTKYVIGMVASFTEKKDYNSYIKAANLILKEEKDITFLCIGAGEFSQFKKMVKPENKDKILFLGKQENVESIMNICSIGVLATFTEGISNSLLEFMALEKPVVVTGEGGCSELILNDKNGFLLDVGDFQGIVSKILYLLENENRLNEFGRMSGKIVIDKFNITKMIDKFKALYNEIAN